MIAFEFYLISAFIPENNISYSSLINMFSDYIIAEHTEHVPVYAATVSGKVFGNQCECD